MRVFVIGHENRPGEIAKASSASLGFSDRGATGFITSDEPGSRAALDEAAVTYIEHEIVQVRLLDQPGTLAQASQLLADAGFNIEFLAPTVIGSGGEVTLALGVGDSQAAAQALGDLAVDA